MQIVINNNFYKKLSPSHRRKAEEAINRLISLEKEGQLLAYLQAQNSKKLKGSEGTRFKYKVSASNRISFFMLIMAAIKAVIVLFLKDTFMTMMTSHV